MNAGFARWRAWIRASPTQMRFHKQQLIPDVTGSTVTWLATTQPSPPTSTGVNSMAMRLSSTGCGNIQYSYLQLNLTIH